MCLSKGNKKELKMRKNNKTIIGQENKRTQEFKYNKTK